MLIQVSIMGKTSKVIKILTFLNYDSPQWKMTWSGFVIWHVTLEQDVVNEFNIPKLQIQMWEILQHPNRTYIYKLFSLTLGDLLWRTKRFHFGIITTLWQIPECTKKRRLRLFKGEFCIINNFYTSPTLGESFECRWLSGKRTRYYYPLNCQVFASSLALQVTIHNNWEPVNIETDQNRPKWDITGLNDLKLTQKLTQKGTKTDQNGPRNDLKWTGDRLKQTINGPKLTRLFFKNLSISGPFLPSRPWLY